MTKTPQTVENQAQAAAILGVSIEDIRQAKAQGCPAFRASSRIHIPTARAWFHQRPASSAPAKTPLQPLTPDELAQLGTLEGSLATAIRDEVEAARLLQRAREDGDAKALPDLTRAVGAARKNRMTSERAVREEKERRGQFITVDAHIAGINKLWYPIITLMRSLPRKLANKVAPADDAFAEKTLAEGVEEAIAEARRTLISPPDMDFHFKVWMLACLEEDDSGTRALARIDDARAEVLAAIEAGKQKA